MGMQMYKCIITIQCDKYYNKEAKLFKYQMMAQSFLFEGIGKGVTKILKLIVLYF